MAVRNLLPIKVSLAKVKEPGYDVACAPFYTSF